MAQVSNLSLPKSKLETCATIHFTLKVAEESIQQKAIVYDRAGDAHYDTISAFIKSMRASDEKGAIYWLAKMLHAGEDFRFIARRIVIFASEDVGLADAQALPLAIATQQAVEFVGMPEAKIPLAHAVCYMCRAKKSRAAYEALGAATEEIETEQTERVPEHLKNKHFPVNPETERKPATELKRRTGNRAPPNGSDVIPSPRRRRGISPTQSASPNVQSARNPLRPSLSRTRDQPARDPSPSPRLGMTSALLNRPVTQTPIVQGAFPQIQSAPATTRRPTKPSSRARADGEGSPLRSPASPERAERAEPTPALPFADARPASARSLAVSAARDDTRAATPPVDADADRSRRVFRGPVPCQHAAKSVNHIALRSDRSRCDTN